jgi:serine/threonine protein phosphatase PrpC
VPLQVAAASSVGVGSQAGGRERNEDNFLLATGDRHERLVGGLRAVDGECVPGCSALVAVCDGMGGHDDGERASAAAVAALWSLYRHGARGDALTALLAGVRSAHRDLHQSEGAAGAVNLGTTLTAAWIEGRLAAWLHIGDSRLYRASARRFERWSLDQTRNEFARRDGIPTRPEWDTLAQSFLFGSRGLGDNSAVRLDRGLDFGRERLEDGDRLVLLSDGIWEAFDDAELADRVVEAATPQGLVDALVAEAVQRGARDNVTAVTVWADDLPPWEGDPFDGDGTDETFQF